jgi:hypothetical protein
MLGQAAVSGCNHEHFAPCGRMDQFFGLKLGFFSTIQPKLRVGHF